MMRAPSDIAKPEGASHICEADPSHICEPRHACTRQQGNKAAKTARRPRAHTKGTQLGRIWVGRVPGTMSCPGRCLRRRSHQMPYMCGLIVAQPGKRPKSGHVT